MPKVMMEEDKMKLTQVKEDVKIKTQCIIQQTDFIHLVLEIVFQPEVMCKAVAEQIWYSAQGTQRRGNSRAENSLGRV